MRPVDEAIRQSALADGAGKKYVMVRLPHLAAEYETAEVADALSLAAVADEAAVRWQAARSLRAVRRRHLQVRSERSRGFSTDEAGTWSSYSLGGRAFTDTLMKLVDVERTVESDVDPAVLHASAMHLLAPCIDGVVDVATQADDRDDVLAAILALGRLSAPQSVEALARRAADADYAVVAAGALAEIGTDDALDALLRSFVRHRDEPFLPELVAELGGFRQSAAFDELVRCIETGTEGVRVNATIALGERGDERARRVLQDLVADESQNVRVFAVEALGRLGCRTAAAGVAEAYRWSTHPLLNEVIVEALGAIGDEGSHDVLYEALGSSHARVRARAVESLVRLRVPDGELFQHAVPLVADPDPLVSANAILALAPVDSSLALQKIFAFLKADNDYGRAQGVYCLSYVQNATTRDLLKGIIVRDDAELVTRQATKALAKYPKDEAVPRLVPLLRHRHKGVRRTAARIMRHIGRPGDLVLFEALAEALPNERSSDVAVALIEALAAVGQSAQHLTLAAFAEGAETDVTAAVVDGLDELGNIASVDLFDELVATPDENVRARAAVGLWHLGHTNLVERLATGLRADDGAERRASLAACGAIGESMQHPSAVAVHPLMVNELRQNAERPDFLASPFADRRSSVDDGARTSSATAESDDLSHRMDLQDLDALAKDFDDESAMVPAPVVTTVLDGPRPHDAAIIVGLQTLADGDAEAAHDLASALVTATDEPTARFLLAKALLHRHRFREAEEQLAVLADGCDDFVNPLLTLVGLCQQRAARRDSVAYFAAAMGAFLETVHGLVATMDSSVRAGRFDVAPAFVRELRQVLPAMERIHGHVGMFLLDLGRPEAAFTHLLRGHLAEPTAGDVILGLARAAIRTGRAAYGRHVLATTLFARSTQGEPARAVAARRAALLCLAEGPRDEPGLELVKRVFRVETEVPVKTLARELIHGWNDGPADDDDGSHDGPGATAPRDDDVERRLEEALTLLTTGSAHEAAAAAEGLAAGSDRVVEARFVHARALLAQGRTADAGALLARGGGDDDPFVNPLLVLVGLCQQHKDHRGMFVQFVHAARATVQLLEDQCEALDRLLMDGDVDGYAWFMRDLSTHLPSVGTLHRRAGLLYLISDEHERAYHHLLFAHACNPVDVEVQRGLAHAALELGQYDVADGICRSLLARCERENVRRDAEACLARLADRGSTT